MERHKRFNRAKYALIISLLVPAVTIGDANKRDYEPTQWRTGSVESGDSEGSHDSRSETRWIPRGVHDAQSCQSLLTQFLKLDQKTPLGGRAIIIHQIHHGVLSSPSDQDSAINAGTLSIRENIFGQLAIAGHASSFKVLPSGLRGAIRRNPLRVNNANSPYFSVIETLQRLGSSSRFLVAGRTGTPMYPDAASAQSRKISDNPQPHEFWNLDVASDPVALLAYACSLGEPWVEFARRPDATHPR